MNGTVFITVSHPGASTTSYPTPQAWKGMTTHE